MVVESATTPGMMSPVASNPVEFAAGLATGAIGQTQDGEECDAVQDDQRPDGCAKSRFHYFLPKLFRKLFRSRSRIHFQQPAKIDDQRQAVFVPQHSDTVRHVFRCFLQQIFSVIYGIGADDFIGGDT